MNTTHRARQIESMDQFEIEAYPEVAEKVGREILESKLDPAAWAVALSACKGDREEALSWYARLRIKSLNGHHRIQLAKIDSFQSRRVMNCLGDPKERAEFAHSVRDLIDQPNPDLDLIFSKPRVSLLWMTILWVGSAGSVAALGQLLSAALPDAVANHLTTGAMIFGLLTITGAMLIHRTLPKHRLIQWWNTGLVAACNLLCLTSLALGTKVITRNLAIEGGQTSLHQAPAAPASPTKVKTVIVKNPYLASNDIVEAQIEN